MSRNTHPTILPGCSPRKAAIAGLLSAAVLFAPMVASADPMTHPHHHKWAAKTAGERAETVEQRITMLHAKLMITPGEANWNAVAQVMRDNETRMQAMIAAREAEPAHHIDAPEDLRVYEHFVQAHVEGLKQLRAAFETLYTAMPDDQKLVADGVFARFGNRHG